MSTTTVRTTRLLGSILVLAVFLVAAAPGIVQGQGPGPDAVKSFWDERRFEMAPARYPGASGTAPEVIPTQQGQIRDWAKLAFASYRDLSDWEVFLALGDGSYPYALTDNVHTDSRPEVNRGATAVAFDSRRDGNYEIYKVNANGSFPTRLTFTSFSEYMPTWSPDGTQIAFYGYPDTQTNAEIYVVNADGSDRVRLTWGPDWDGHPTWSPDGTRIAFISNRSGANEYELWTMSADGSDPQRVTYGLISGAYPDWSPDGTRFVLNDDFNGDYWYDLAIVNADGTGLIHPRDATPALTDSLGPTWSPTGDDIAFSLISYTYYQGNWYWVDAYIYGLWLVGSQLYPLVNTGFDWWPDWQTVDTLPPETQVEALLPWSQAVLPVSWGGMDPGGAGLRSYDVQYRDGSGDWVDWFSGTADTVAIFWDGQDGHTYYFRCRARDYAGNLETYLEPPDAFTVVDTAPPTSAASSPPYVDTTPFVVTWSGSDAGAGIVAYTVQVRDGDGSWNDWRVEVTSTMAVYTGAQAGHTYYFQSRAYDAAGNEEVYPGGDGDTCTHVPQYALSGYVLNAREQPVALGLVQATPPLSNTAYSRVDGSFTLYGDVTGTYALGVARSGFGALPPMQGVDVPGDTPTFYLPPLDDAIADGGFEAGHLAAWQVEGRVPIVLTATAHTGDYGIVLGGSVPPPMVTPTAAFTASAVVTAAGGVVTSSLAVLAIPTGTVSGTVVFTLTGVPTVTGLPAGTQDVGLHLAWTAAPTDGTPLTATLRPVTLTVRYNDAQWQAAQVAGEETLALWAYDPVNTAWAPLSGTLDLVSNTVTVTTTVPGRYALLGAPYAGPWAGVLSQEVVLSPAPATATLSLLYQVTGTAPPTTTFMVYVAGQSATVTYTLPLTASGWVHRWWEVPPSLGPTLTVRLAWAQGSRETTVRAVLDEVSLGTAAAGSFTIYLPILYR